MKIKPYSILFALVLFALCSSALVVFGQGLGQPNPTNVLVITSAATAPEPDIFGFTKTDVTAFFGALAVIAMYVGRIFAAIKAGTSVFKALFGGSAPAVKALQEQVSVIPTAIQTSDTRFLVKAIEVSKEEKKTL